MHKFIVSFFTVVLLTCLQVNAQFRELALQATDIIVVDGMSRYKIDENADYVTEPYEYYNLYIRQVMKGDFDRSVPVLMRCGQYDVFSEDEVYFDEKKAPEQNVRLFFLKKENHGYTYLANYEKMSENDVYFIRQQLSALFDLVKTENKKIRFNQTLQWIINCSANKYTASAVSDLSVYSQFFSYYEKEGIIVDKVLPFTMDQRTVLKDNLLKLEIDYEMLSALGMLYKDFPVEIEKALIKKMNSLDEYDMTYFAAYVMETLVSATGIKDMDGYIEKYKNAGADSGVYKKQIDHFLKAYQKKKKNG